MISDKSLRVLLRSDRAVALWGDFIRAALMAVMVILIGMAGLYHAAIVRVMVNQLYMNDFGKFYYSARYFLSGYDMYTLSPATTLPYGNGDTHQFLNMNPPHFHLLILPLARLEPTTALLVWSFMGFAGLLWSAWLITKELRLRWTVARALWAVLLFLLCSSTGAVIVTGQLTFQLLPFITLAWIAARRHEWIRAGILLGVVAGIKPHLGVFGLFLIVAGQWRAAIAMASTVLASFGLGLLVFGWETHRQWLTALGAVDWSWAPMNGSIAGLFARMFDGGALPALIPAPGLGHVLSVIASFVILGVAIKTIVRSRGAFSADWFFALAVLTAQLVSPLGWIYYLWLAGGPLLSIWMSARETPYRARDMAIWLALPGLFWPLPLFSASPELWWQAFTLRSIYTWTTLWLWVAAVLDAGRVTSRISTAPDTRPDS